MSYAHLRALVEGAYLVYERPSIRAYRPGKRKP
jgi:hypothetical protein